MDEALSAQERAASLPTVFPELNALLAELVTRIGSIQVVAVERQTVPRITQLNVP